jgi:hypothetical protein
LRLDTLHAETVGGIVNAHGAFGLTGAVTDSLRYTVKIDSPEGFVATSGRPRSRSSTAASPSDSIDGTVNIGSSVQQPRFARRSRRQPGRTRRLDSWRSGEGRCRWLRVQQRQGAISQGLSVRIDTAVVANVGISNGTLAFRASGDRNGQFRVEAASVNGPSLLVPGTVDVR